MSSGSVEDRIVQLEQKVRHLESDARSDANARPWWERVAGAFKDDQVYVAAKKPGAEFRKADRPEVAGE
jgi:hypothetical protein